MKIKQRKRIRLSLAKGVGLSHVEIRGRALQVETKVTADSQRPETAGNGKGQQVWRPSRRA